MSPAEFIELAALGLGAGMWGALIGAGGGFIIVPVLLFFKDSLSPAEVTAVSLIAVFSNGVSGTVAYARAGRVDYGSALRFLVATIPGGIIGALLVNYVKTNLFQSIFGTLLVLVALYIFSRPTPRARTDGTAQGTPRRLVTRQGTVYEYRVNLKLGTGLNLLDEPAY